MMTDDCKDRGGKTRADGSCVACDAIAGERCRGRTQNDELAREVLQAFIKSGRPIIAAMFAGYRRAVMHPNAGPMQTLECKRAYFAGARSMIDLMAGATDPGLDVTANDEKIMQAIVDELADWMDEGQMAEHVAAVPPEGRA